MNNSVFLLLLTEPDEEEPVAKKPKMFYGAQKIAKKNETALQAVKRAKALAAVKAVNLGKVN